MNEKEEKIYMHAANVEMAIRDMLTNEDSDYYVNLAEEDGDLTSFVTGMCIAHLKILLNLCNKTGNYLDGIHLENRLIVQYLMEYGKINKEP